MINIDTLVLSINFYGIKKDTVELTETNLTKLQHNIKDYLPKILLNTVGWSENNKVDAVSIELNATFKNSCEPFNRIERFWTSDVRDREVRTIMPTEVTIAKTVGNAMHVVRELEMLVGLIQYSNE